MPIAMPTAQMRLSPAQAGAIAQRARQLLRKGRLTVHQFALVDAMLWAARKPGEAMLIASGKVLARLAGQARSTITGGIYTLMRLGLVQRIRRRVRVAWIGGATASRQIANAYRFLAPDTESAPRTADQGVQIYTCVAEPTGAQRQAQETLAQVRAAGNARLAAQWKARLLGKGKG